MTTSNSGKQIVTKGSGHTAVATEDDMCKVPGKTQPQPFPNWVESNMLLAGRTVTVLIDGQPVMVKRSELGPPSEPAHEGTLGGVKSKAYRGHAMAAEWSQDVGMEGEPVVRQHDRTTHNHNGSVFNTVGILVTGDAAGMLSELYKKYGLTPRRYCGFLNGSNVSERRFKAAVASEAKRLNALAQGKGFDISADELALNFLSEGGNGYIAADTPDGINAFGVGADTLVSNRRAASPWYTDELRNIVSGGKQNFATTNEKGENVVTLSDLTMEQAVQGNASLYAWSKSQFVNDLKAKGIDYASLPKNEQFFWSTVYFNTGPGNGRKYLNQHGLKWHERKWRGPDFPTDPDERLSFTLQHQRNPHFNAMWRTSSYEFMLRMCGGAIK